MLVTIKATQDTTHFAAGEVRTVELTPFVRGLIRNGLAVQLPRTDPDPAPAKPPAKKTARRVAKKASEPAEETDGLVVVKAPAELIEQVALVRLDPEQE